jgi:hypothetical protein
MVGTIMATTASFDWHGTSLRTLIGRALLDATKAMTAKDLEGPVRAHQSNIKKEADRMAIAGLLTAVPPVGPRAGSGRRAQRAYVLSPEQRSRAASQIPPPAAPNMPDLIGLLRRGQEIVTARADRDHLSDLMHVLAEAESARSALWSAMCGEDLLLVFDDPDPADAAMDLLTLLDAARVPAERRTVARVRPVPELIDDARRAIPNIRATRIRRDTRHLL